MTRKERKKRAIDKRRRRRAEKDRRLYDKYARVRIRRPPRPMKVPITFAAAFLIVIIYWDVTMLLVKGAVTAFEEFATLLAGCVFAVIVIVLREGTVASAGRTLKLKMGDAPAMVADGFVPGGIVRSLKFRGTDDKGLPFEETRHFEFGWCGPIKRWPFRGRGPLMIGLCQYNIGDDDKPPQAGFMLGDEYVMPLYPDAYRFDMLKQARDPRYAEMVKSIEEIGNRVHDRTWIILGTRPMPLPDRKVFEGSVVDDMELFHEKRLRKRVTSTLHDVGIDDKITKSIGVGRR